MILPVGASKFEEALQIGSETYHHLKVSSQFTFVISLEYTFTLLKFLSLSAFQSYCTI